MFDNLEAVKNRFEEINMKLQDPSVVSDNEEYKNLTPIVEKYEEYAKAKSDFQEAKELLDEGGLDAEFKEIAQMQYEENKDLIETISTELKILLLPKDENDDRNIIMEIRAGTGGEEAALFGYNMYRMYLMFAESQGWKTEIISLNETEIGGFKEVEFMIDGDNVYSRLKFESGTHRVQRVPDTESQGRIQTSAVTVVVMPEAEEVEIDLNMSDVKIDVFRASGAGGQHINKTSSAIRMTHLPTGVVAECQDERSQLKNKDKALKVLRSRLYQQKLDAHNSKISAERKSIVGSGDRSERIRTYNYPQGRVSDHRVNLTLYKLDSIMNGNLNEIIDVLVTAEQTEKLQRADGN